MNNLSILTQRKFVFAGLVALLILIGLLRIVSTYHVFWATWDEPAHIGPGMEWLDKGQFTYEHFHPPLARVMSALGPYLAGLRSVGKGTMYEEGNFILQQNGAYEYNLTLARLGILPFFILATVVVAVWAKKYGGPLTALLAVVFVTTSPSILGHSGVAALDMACAACTALALFAFDNWLQRPTVRRSCFLGIAGALALLSKLQAGGFLIIAGSLILIVYAIRLFRDRSPESKKPWRIKPYVGGVALALLLFSLTVWAAYRFSTSYLLEPGTHGRVDQIVGAQGILHDAAYFVLEKVPIPAPEFRQGILDFFVIGGYGELDFFLGEIRQYGWWYFYPVVLLFKTPLPFLILSFIGFFFIFKHAFTQDEAFHFTMPAVSAFGVLATGMLSSVDNGSREVLAIFPLLAIVAGYGAAKLLALPQRFHYAGIGLVTLLVAWQVVASATAHPDYITYFNELAGKHPENIVIDGDLDWGQDLKRLSIRLKQRGVKQFTLKYFGGKRMNLDLFDLPPREKLQPYQVTRGWIAISIYHLRLGAEEPPYDQFAWLNKFKPKEIVGKSIWLYYIPKSAVEP